MMKVKGTSDLLTHIVEAIGFSSFGAQERHIYPFAVAVGVAFNQVVRRLSISDPVTQELTDAAGMDHAIAENSPNFEEYGSAFSSSPKRTKKSTDKMENFSHTYPKPISVQ